MSLVKFFLYLLPIIAFISVFTARELGRGTLGSEDNPIKLYFAPSVDAQTITTTGDALTSYLLKETGLHFRTAIPSNYIAIVEAIGSNKCDIAIVNTFTYLLANQKYGATAKLRVIRDDGETTYRGQFVTSSNSGINTIEDLAGKKIAYTDPASTSGYILPKALLASKNIKPAQEVFAAKHDNVITMVYQGQVDAGATYYSPPAADGTLRDARVRVITQFPDVAKKIKIIGFTEQIPNDPVIFNKALPRSIQKKVVEALLKFVNTKEGQKALYSIYSVRGLVATKDEDFDVLRDLLKRIDVDIEGSVK